MISVSTIPWIFFSLALPDEGTAQAPIPRLAGQSESQNLHRETWTQSVGPSLGAKQLRPAQVGRQRSNRRRHQSLLPCTRLRRGPEGKA